jgi:hypothetical protein
MVDSYFRPVYASFSIKYKNPCRKESLSGKQKKEVKYVRRIRISNIPLARSDGMSCSANGVSLACKVMFRLHA